MKKLIWILFTLLLLSSLNACGCYSLKESGFGTDGKAVSWCKRENRADKLCKKHDGVERYNFKYALCKDGTEFTGEVENF